MDGIADLAVERDKERKYRVTPTSRDAKEKTITLKKDESTIGRKSGAGTSIIGHKRPGSSASNYGSIGT